MIVRLFLAACLIAAWGSASPVLAGTEVSTFEEPDVNRSYCGKEVPYSLCRCAFSGQSCEGMRIDQARAKGELEAKFKQWVGMQIEKVATACIDDGGHWKTATRQCVTCTEGDVYYKNKCTSPDKVGADAVAAACPAMIAFSKDWVAASGFANVADNDTDNEAVRAYFSGQNRLTQELIAREAGMYNMTVLNGITADLLAYQEALRSDDVDAASVAYAAIARDFWLLPMAEVTEVELLFSDDDELTTGTAELVRTVAGEDFTFASFTSQNRAATIKEAVFTSPLASLRDLAAARKQAEAALAQLPKAASVAPVLSTDDVQTLREAHAENLLLDKTRARLAAQTASLRLQNLRSEVAALEVYTQMQAAKEAEFINAKTAVATSCEG